jgi:hypothetical protein
VFDVWPRKNIIEGHLYQWRRANNIYLVFPSRMCQLIRIQFCVSTGGERNLVRSFFFFIFLRKDYRQDSSDIIYIVDLPVKGAFQLESLYGRAHLPAVQPWAAKRRKLRDLCGMIPASAAWTKKWQISRYKSFAHIRAHIDSRPCL